MKNPGAGEHMFQIEWIKHVVGKSSQFGLFTSIFLDLHHIDCANAFGINLGVLEYSKCIAACPVGGG